MLGEMAPDRFREDARRALDWTAARLTPKARRFVTSWPMVLAGPGFRCVHAEFADPCGFQYLLEPADAEPSWAADRADANQIALARLQREIGRRQLMRRAAGADDK